MASHDGSRKKRKVALQSTNGGAIASGSALPPNTLTMDNPPASAPCHHEHALKTLNTDLDAMRQLITCKICDRLLYEPYALSCGHTYCYSCLSQWLGTNARMTCPDCRTIIRQQPTPSYIIRELVLVFVSRNELLPDGETADEHNKLVREEAEIVAKDKASTDLRTGGLFKGRFKSSRLNVLGPLHDPGDRVDRCPHCHWELEDGHCEHCGYEDDDLDADFDAGDSDIGSYISDYEVDLELDDMQDADAHLGADGTLEWYQELMGSSPTPPNVQTNPRHGRRHQRPANRPNTIDLAASSGEESDEEEYDPEVDAFIDDAPIDEEEHSDSESDATAGRSPAPPAVRNVLVTRNGSAVPARGNALAGRNESVLNARSSNGRLNRRVAPVVISDDEDEDEGAPSTAQGGDESGSDSEDEGPVARGSQRVKRNNAYTRPRPAVALSSDDESEDSVHDGHNEATARGGFSPIDYGEGDEVSEQTDYDDDNDSYSSEDGLSEGPTFNPYHEVDDGGQGLVDESDEGYEELDA